MKVIFFKYHGTGNDFIIIDNRKKRINLSLKQIVHICNRKFGIGADGLIYLQLKKGFDFEMVYFNSDGRESSFCGNGSRCIVHLAKALGIIKKSEISFIATDGIHNARIKNDKVSIKMKDVNLVENISDNDFFLNTGSPHFVRVTENVKEIDIISESRKVRYSERFAKNGVNVNFIEKSDKGIFVRTYERGIENETLSCGTGVTASAIVAAIKGISTSQTQCKILTPGGELTVKFRMEKPGTFSDIWLEGPAVCVFKGEIKL